MSVRRRAAAWVSAAGAISVIGLSGAVAQPQQQPAPQETTPADEQPGEQRGEGAIEVEEAADLTPQQQRDQAREIQRNSDKLSKRVQGMLDEARREQDIIRVTCLNDKLTQINANRRTLADRVDSMEQAIEAGDRQRRNHEYTVITVLAQKFDTLEQEANQCLGQDLFETGATRVVTDVDPGSPDEDPTTVQDSPTVATPLIPPPSSPTS